MKTIARQTLHCLSICCLFFSSIAISEEQKQYNIDVWADNWFAVYIDAKPLFENLVSIKTERSFNANHISVFCIRYLCLGI